MINYFVISYNIGEAEDDVIGVIKSFGDCKQYVNNGWILKSTSENSQSIYEKLRTFFQEGSGHLLVSKVDKADMAGWLASDVVDWLTSGSEDDKTN